jgi:hypothetical protein
MEYELNISHELTKDKIGIEGKKSTSGSEKV